MDVAQTVQVCRNARGRPEKACATRLRQGLRYETETAGGSRSNVVSFVSFVPERKPPARSVAVNSAEGNIDFRVAEMISVRESGAGKGALAGEQRTGDLAEGNLQ